MKATAALMAGSEQQCQQHLLPHPGRSDLRLPSALGPVLNNCAVYPCHLLQRAINGTTSGEINERERLGGGGSHII